MPAGIEATIADVASGEGSGSGAEATTGARRIVRERSKLVIIVAGPDAQGKVDAIVEAYKRKFRQQSVGVVVRPACVSF